MPRHHFPPIGLCLCIFFVWTGVRADFYDDFSNGSSEWEPAATGAELEVSTAQGVLSVTNTSQNTGIILRKNVSVGNFTFSVRMRAPARPYSRVGICFGMSASLSGYCCTLDDRQRFTLTRLPTGEPLAYLPHSALDTLDNLLRVSAQDGKVFLYANDKLLYSFTETEPVEGGLGFFVYPGETVTFDDARHSSGAQTGAPDSCLSLQYSDTNDCSWFLGRVNGPLGVDDGALRWSVPATDSVGNYILKSGKFAHSAVKTIITRSSGSLSEAAGICLAQYSQTSGITYTTRTALFLVSGTRYYGIKAPDQTTYTFRRPLESPIHGTTDTLMLLQKTTATLFLVNGVVLDSLPRGDFLPNATGLFAYPDLALSVTSFQVAPDSTFVCSQPTSVIPLAIRRSLRPGHNSGYACGIFDLRGRLSSEVSRHQRVTGVNLSPSRKQRKWLQLH